MHYVNGSWWSALGLQVRMALLVRPRACPAPAHTVALGGAIERGDTVLDTFRCPSQRIRRYDANLSGLRLLQYLLSQVSSLNKVQATSALSGRSAMLLESESLAFPNHPYMDSPLSCRKDRFSPPLPYLWGCVITQTRNLTWVVNKPTPFLLLLLFPVLRILGWSSPPLLRPHKALGDGAVLQQGSRSCSRLGKGVTRLVCTPTASD